MAAGDGLVSMKPTSIAHSGTSAVINADGGVDFTAVTSLSLNGVFTSDHDNYVIVIRHSSSGSPSLDLRFRVSGSDASGANYTRQVLQANGSTASAPGRFSGETVIRVGISSSAQRSGDTIHVYGPALAQPTATRNVNVRGQSDAFIQDIAGTHSLSTAYDGFTILPDAGTASITGNVHVFGYEE